MQFWLGRKSHSLLVIWIRVLENLICAGKSEILRYKAEVASVAGVILKFDPAPTVFRAGTGRDIG